MCFKCIERVECAVVKEPLPQLISYMLLRVKFGRIRRQKYRAHIFGQLELLASVPTRPINHHDYIFVPITRRDLVQKQLHAMAVNLRQDQPRFSIRKFNWLPPLEKGDRWGFYIHATFKSPLPPFFKGGNARCNQIYA